MNQFGCTWLYSYVMWVKYKLLSIRLEIVLTSTQDSWMVCMERPIGSKIILGTPDGTPRRCGSVECHSIYLVMVLISALDRCTACTECTTDTESFWLHSVDLQDDVGKMEAHFGLFWDMLISTQDRCTVHVEHAIGSEFILGTPDGTPRWRGSSGRSLDLLGQGVKLYEKVHGMHRMYHGQGNHFGRTRWNY
jgi:hypothetical protein